MEHLMTIDIKYLKSAYNNLWIDDYNRYDTLSYDSKRVLYSQVHNPGVFSISCKPMQTHTVTVQVRAVII